MYLVYQLRPKSNTTWIYLTKVKAKTFVKRSRTKVEYYMKDYQRIRLTILSSATKDEGQYTDHQELFKVAKGQRSECRRKLKIDTVSGLNYCTRRIQPDLEQGGQ